MDKSALADLSFTVFLLPKILLVVLLVVTATVASEKLGPVIGALIATLPVTSGPVFFFLALNHDASFISQTALSTLSQNIPTAIFVTGYVFLARRLPTRMSVPLSLAIWGGYVLLSLWGDQGRATAIVMSLMIFPLCIISTLPYGRVAAAAGKTRASDIAARAIVVALFVAIVETLSLFAGPELTGVLVAFPTVFICMMVILQPRLGGPAAAAVMAHALPGFVGISIAFLAINLLAVPLGAFLALAIGLCISVCWNLCLFALQRLTPFHVAAASQANLRS